MPVLDIIGVLFWAFLLVAWVVVVVTVIADVVRSDDLSGWAKAAWIAFVFLVPWLGVVVYLIVRGKSMTQRYLANRADKANRRSYTASGFSTNEGLETWRRDAGLVYGRV